MVKIKKNKVSLFFIFLFFFSSFFFPSLALSDDCPNRDLGNINCDSEGRIDQNDLEILLSCWSGGEVSASSCFDINLTLETPPKINESDLSVILKNWAPAGLIDFYGKKVRLLKLFGQSSFGETSADTVVSNKIFHASGVLVDKSQRPNVVYVADTGNNRILGFESLGSCQGNPQIPCTNDTDCQPSDICIVNTRKEADIIFGQTSENSASCNGDNNLGIYKNPTASTLCLVPFPDVTNTGEYWMRTNFDVDSEGNLYIPDVHNNRVLKFNQPFSSDKTNGKGDNIADFVWGQPDFNSNGINMGMGPNQRNKKSLWISWGNNYGFDHVSSRGVSVDSQGNVWIADTFNSRVLRFPKNSKEADLVIGQSDFESNTRACYEGAPLDKLCTPTLARLDSETGKLYVLDEWPSGFRARLLVFQPPFNNGMSASKVISINQIGLIKDFPCFGGTYHFQSTGFIFNTFKEGEYANGVLWINENCSKRVILIDENGNIIKVIGAPDQNSNGCNYGYYGNCGKDIFSNFNLCWPGGQIGIDNANNIYLADEHFHRIARFSLPYNTYQYENPYDGNIYTCLPNANGGLFEGTLPNAVSGFKFLEAVGTITFDNQLIVKDRRRYLVWNDYLDKPIGSEADLVIGQKSKNERIGDEFGLGDRSFHAIDDQNRLWAIGSDGKLIVFQLPFQTQNQPPLARNIKLYWQDDGSEVDYSAFEAGLAFDKINKKLWVVDRKNNRLLRISNYNDFQKRLIVDMVLGQPNKEGKCCNQESPNPDGSCRWTWVAETPPRADTLCDPRYIQFDKFGNLYVVENTYECHGNNRIVVFMKEDLGAASSLFPNLAAKKVFVSERFDQLPTCALTGNPCGRRKTDEPESPITLAFNSKNQMVVGNDGYYSQCRERSLRQLWFYNDPLKRNSDGSFVQGQKPDAYIEIPIGAVGETSFDKDDNLIIQDHTWPRVWIINLDKDPSWLVSLK